MEEKQAQFLWDSGIRRKKEQSILSTSSWRPQTELYQKQLNKFTGMID